MYTDTERDLRLLEFLTNLRDTTPHLWLRDDIDAVLAEYFREEEEE